MKGKDVKKIFNMHFDAYIDDNKDYDIEGLGSYNRVYLNAKKNDKQTDNCLK